MLGSLEQRRGRHRLVLAALCATVALAVLAAGPGTPAQAAHHHHKVAPLTFKQAMKASIAAARDQAETDAANGATNVHYYGRSCKRRTRLKIRCLMSINGFDPSHVCNPASGTGKGADYTRAWAEIVSKNARTKAITARMKAAKVTYTCPG